MPGVCGMVALNSSVCRPELGAGISWAGTPGVVVYQCLPHQFGSTKETTKIGSSGGPRPVFLMFSVS